MNFRLLILTVFFGLPALAAEDADAAGDGQGLRGFVAGGVE